MMSRYLSVPHRRRSLVELSVAMAATALGLAACSAPQSAQAPAASQQIAGDSTTTATSPPAAAPAPAPVAPATTSPPATTARPAAPGAAPITPAPATPAAAAPAAPPAPARPAEPVKVAPRVAELKSGQPITVRTTRALSTSNVKTGDVFSAIVEDPIVIDGFTAIASGARVEGRVSESDKGGRVKGKASLSLELTSVTASNGRKVEIVTSPIDSEAASNKGKDAKRVGVGAGAGAAVGAIAGGGKGAAIGALVGGGAGAAMRGDAAEIAAESVITFELRTPVTITEKK